MKDIKDKQYQIYDMVRNLKQPDDPGEKVKLLKFPKEMTKDPPKVQGRNLMSPPNVRATQQQNNEGKPKIFKSDDGKIKEAKSSDQLNAAGTSSR